MDAWFLIPFSYCIIITTIKSLKTNNKIYSNTITTQITSNGIQYSNPGGQLTFDTSVAFNNNSPATGGKDGDTADEIRENSLRASNAQLRAVTLSDYVVRALSMPTKFGAVAKAYANPREDSSIEVVSNLLDNRNPYAIGLHVLSYDADGTLKPASDLLKSNLKTYIDRYRMLTDAVDIRDAFIINIKLNYEISIRPNFSARNVLLRVNRELRDYFDITKWGINQPINIAEIRSLIDSVRGVQTVRDIKFTTISGGDYSEFDYDLVGATRRDLIYPSFDPMIFEIKFPDTDIKGRIVND